MFLFVTEALFNLTLFSPQSLLLLSTFLQFLFSYRQKNVSLSAWCDQVYWYGTAGSDGVSPTHQWSSPPISAGYLTAQRPHSKTPSTPCTTPSHSCCLKCRTSKLKDSFYPEAIRLINTSKPPPLPPSPHNQTKDLMQLCTHWTFCTCYLSFFMLLSTVIT